MKPANVKLILQREVRDQMRDRRTLFMIFVLPILLYPLMAMASLQLTQFMREHPTRVLIVGAKGLPVESASGVEAGAEGGRQPSGNGESDLLELPPLFQANYRYFANGLCPDPSLLELTFAPDEPEKGTDEPIDWHQRAREQVQAGLYEAAVIFPPDFADRLRQYQESVRRRVREAATPQGQDASAAAALEVSVPKPELLFTSADEKSGITYESRLTTVFNAWASQVQQQTLAELHLPQLGAKPFEVKATDVGEEEGFGGAALWAKILPMLLLIWAMTGAFYPAVDLCAGEKERGTLETLLSSPAERSEIVLGKLLTVMLFSAATAVLNLVSIVITGALVLSQIPELGPPPPLAPLWLALALIPSAALFGALCLALAAFARSTKEGQYYLMPLMLVTIPLALFPMAPGVELNLGNSLIPASGLVLLLKTLLQGDYATALRFTPPVLAITLACCLLAIRWAVNQFNSEKVLFRESERLDMGLWLRHLVRDRRPTPSVAEAVFCAVLLLVIRIFVGFAMPGPTDFGVVVVTTIVTQVVVVLAPVLLLTWFLTSSPRRTLLLHLPTWWTVPAAALLALALHPAAQALVLAVSRLYPVDPRLGALGNLFEGVAYWKLFLLIALLPAVCEELAFRGFILSGLRGMGGKWRAIVYSSIFFGVTHIILQQSIVTCLIGVVIGYLAVQSGSLLPGMVFHLCHNGLSILSTKLTPAVLDRWPALHGLFVTVDGTTCMFRWQAVVAGMAVGAILLSHFRRLWQQNPPGEAVAIADEHAAPLEPHKPMLENG